MLLAFKYQMWKDACHDNPSAVRKWAGSSLYISRHIFLNFSITSAKNNVSLWIYKS